MAKTKGNPRKGLHLHRTHPILLGGDPLDKKNITFVTKLQHAELATFWNKTIKANKGSNQ